jgi:hypothetical protein
VTTTTTLATVVDRVADRIRDERDQPLQPDKARLVTMQYAYPLGIDAHLLGDGGHLDVEVTADQADAIVAAVQRDIDSDRDPVLVGSAHYRWRAHEGDDVEYLTEQGTQEADSLLQVAEYLRERYPEVTLRYLRHAIIKAINAGPDDYPDGYYLDDIAEEILINLMGRQLLRTREDSAVERADGTVEYAAWFEVTRHVLDVPRLDLGAPMGTVQAAVAAVLWDYATPEGVAEVTVSYRDAINAALPPDIRLAGLMFLGPYPQRDSGLRDIRAAIQSVDLPALTSDQVYDQ